MFTKQSNTMKKIILEATEERGVSFIGYFTPEKQVRINLTIPKGTTVFEYKGDFLVEPSMTLDFGGKLNITEEKDGIVIAKDR